MQEKTPPPCERRGFEFVAPSVFRGLGDFAYLIGVCPLLFVLFGGLGRLIGV